MSKTPISILLIATVLSLGCIIVPSVHAQAGPVVRTNTDVPVDEQFFIPCANNNQGDTIQISGTAHEVFDVTVDNNGGFHLHENSNGQDLTGVSQTTGAEYHVGGQEHATLNGVVGLESILSETFTLIGEGTAANLVFHAEVHITVNADGTVTANINHGDVHLFFESLNLFGLFL